MALFELPAALNDRQINKRLINQRPTKLEALEMTRRIN